MGRRSCHPRCSKGPGPGSSRCKFCRRARSGTRRAGAAHGCCSQTAPAAQVSRTAAVSPRAEDQDYPGNRVPCLRWTGGTGSQGECGAEPDTPSAYPGRTLFPKCADPGANEPRQTAWGQLHPVPCPLAALGRSRREDSPALVITSCPGWEKAPEGKERLLQLSRSLLGAPAWWDPRVAGCRALVPAPAAPCWQPGLADTLPNLSSTLQF